MGRPWDSAMRYFCARAGGGGGGGGGIELCAASPARQAPAAQGLGRRKDRLRPSAAGGLAGLLAAGWVGGRPLGPALAQAGAASSAPAEGAHLKVTLHVVEGETLEFHCFQHGARPGGIRPACRGGGVRVGGWVWVWEVARHIVGRGTLQA